MAKRIRTHILEDESRTAFMQILPPEWVYRDKDKDYGIDCEVEIFEKNGNSTGIMFFVQLKATDSLNDNNKLKISFALSKINQFYSYELPVLIVRYISSEKSFYIKWANEITIFDKSKKVINVEFTEKNRWNENTSENIRGYLDKISVIKNRKLNFPIPIYILNESLGSKKNNPRILISNLRSELNQYDKFIVNCKYQDNTLLTIELHKNYILVNLNTLGKSRLNINLDRINLSTNFFRYLAQVILINIGICLSQIGYDSLCVDLIFRAKLFEVIKKDEDILTSLLYPLLHSSHFNEVVEHMIDYSRQNKDKHNLVQILVNSLILHKKGTYDDRELKTIENYLISEIELSKEREFNPLIAVSYYNLGNHYKGISEYSSAIKNYIQAKKYNKKYKLKPYYYYELGGILFSIEKYYWSSLAYKKAIDLGEKRQAKALYADALMFQGQYSLACDFFNKYLLENNDDTNYEWHLKFSCLTTLLEHGWARRQIRDSKSAEELIKNGKFEEALKKDFLSNWAWYNYGVFQNDEKKNYNEATIAFSMAALLRPYDIEAWVNATGCCLACDFENNYLFSYYIINCAYYYNDEKYLNALFSHPNFISDNSFYEMIDTIIVKSNHDKKNDIELRIFDNESVDEISDLQFS